MIVVDKITWHRYFKLEFRVTHNLCILVWRSLITAEVSGTALADITAVFFKYVCFGFE